MQTVINKSIWYQFGATIDSLMQSIDKCPDADWNNSNLFWYKVYHTLFWTDYYACESVIDFAPPNPFTLTEFDATGILPPCVYTKAELLHYAMFCKQKCKQLIDGLNENTMQARFVNEYKNFNRLEIILYSMRHVQHHVGQLNMLLRQADVDTMHWVNRVDGIGSLEQ